MEFQAASVCFRSPFRNGKTETRATGLAGAPFVNTVESVKYSIAMLQRDAWPAVFHLD